MFQSVMLSATLPASAMMGWTNLCDDGGPADAGLVTVAGANYLTIDDAIAAAQDGDVVYVCQGTWGVSESITRSITLYGVDGAALVAIDGLGRTGTATLDVQVPYGQVRIQGVAVVGGDPGEPGIRIGADTAVDLIAVDVHGHDGRGIEVHDLGQAVLTDSEVRENAGGGIEGLGAGLIALSGSVVWGNTAIEGGGVRVDDGRMVLGGEITGNVADRGGGIHATGGIVWGTDVRDNTAIDGGGLYLARPGTGFATTTLDSATIRFNDAELGGGIYAEPYDASRGTVVVMEATVVSENDASVAGGGVWLGALELEGDGASVISGNTAQSGGGIAVHNLSYGQAPITDLEISGNVAQGDGGGIWIDRIDVAPTWLERTTVTGNIATRGGGIATRPLPTPAPVFAELVLEDSTLTDNVATEGGGLWLSDRGARLRFSTITGNDATTGAGARVTGTGTLLMSYTCTWSNVPEDIAAGTETYVYGATDFTCGPMSCAP